MDMAAICQEASAQLDSIQQRTTPTVTPLKSLASAVGFGSPRSPPSTAAGASPAAKARPSNGGAGSSPAAGSASKHAPATPSRSPLNVAGKGKGGKAGSGSSGPDAAGEDGYDQVELGQLRDHVTMVSGVTCMCGQPEAVRG